MKTIKYHYSILTTIFLHLRTYPTIISNSPYIQLNCTPSLILTININYIKKSTFPQYTTQHIVKSLNSIQLPKSQVTQSMHQQQAFTPSLPTMSVLPASVVQHRFEHIRGLGQHEPVRGVLFRGYLRSCEVARLGS